MIRKALRLMFAVALCEIAGLVGAFYTSQAIPTWYAGLIKSELTPPSWIFAPVWTTLFALMGIAVFIIWHKGPRRTDVRVAVVFFAMQLILNVAWSYIFFGMHAPGKALIDILLLWSMIMLTTLTFHPISKIAAWLMVPYLLWVTFAAYLNLTVWLFN